MPNSASFNQDSDSSSINFDFISETTPLTQDTRANYFSGCVNDDILSSSLLVEMKNLKNKKPPKSLPYHPKNLIKNATIKGGPTHEDPIDGNQTDLERKKALQLWQNTINIDQLLIQGKGFKVMLFQRICSVFTIGFIVIFFLFLLNCIDYKRLLNPDQDLDMRHRKLITFIHLNRVFSISFFWGICFVIFISYWIWQILKLIFEYNDLVKIRDIYTHLLDIPDRDLATLSIQDIIKKVIEVNDKFPLDPSGMQLDAHVIANRILRRENYFISLLNKNILDLHPPLPMVFGTQPLLTKTMEINLSICILQFVFDSNGHIRKKFVENVQINELALELRKRFVIMAFMNLLASPFILAFLGVYFIFRYGEELYRNPKMLGTRQYTPYALWQFRELNELQSFFDERINQSLSAAKTYTSLYPNHLVAIAAKFFGFVAGSLAFVLILWGLLVEDLLLDLEITTGRTMLWYIGVLGVFVAFCRSLIPDETIIYKPEVLLKEVTFHLRYFPLHWRETLHTKMVRNEFSSLFHYKIAIFLHEMLSIILTPIIMCFSLPTCSTAIISFFKDFSVHVDGLGYVCSFALFDFYKNGNPRYGCVTELKKNQNMSYFQSEQGKMEKSFLNFKEKFPEWTPGPSGTMYLSRLVEFNAKGHHVAKKQQTKPLPPFGPAYSKTKNLPSGLSMMSPLQNVRPLTLIESESLPFTPEDEYKLRITSSSSSDDQCTEGGGGMNADSISAGFDADLIKSRSKGKRLISSSNKNQAVSESLLDLMNKYVDNQNEQ